MKDVKPISLAACVALLAVAASAAQQAEPPRAYPPQVARPLPYPPRAPQSQKPATGTKTEKLPPCWQQAGLSKQTFEQRRAIQARTRAEVGSVCADPNLNDQQKREKIREIHQQAQREVQALIPQHQLQELEVCQKARRKTPVPLAGGPRTGYPRHGPCDLR